MSNDYTEACPRGQQPVPLKSGGIDCLDLSQTTPSICSPEYSEEGGSCVQYLPGGGSAMTGKNACPPGYQRRYDERLQERICVKITPSSCPDGTTGQMTMNKAREPGGFCVPDTVALYDTLEQTETSPADFWPCNGDDRLVFPMPGSRDYQCLPSAPVAVAAASSSISAPINAPPPLDLTPQTGFDQALKLYRTNMTEYKVSGNAAFKTASDTAKKWLDDYLQSLEENADKNKKDIEDFVKNYDQSDTELASLKQDMRQVREKGPELQILYETERNAQTPQEQVDFTTYYAKGAVLAGVIGLIAVASFI